MRLNAVGMCDEASVEFVAPVPAQVAALAAVAEPLSTVKLSGLKRSFNSDLIIGRLHLQFIPLPEHRNSSRQPSWHPNSRRSYCDKQLELFRKLQDPLSTMSDPSSPHPPPGQRPCQS